MIKDYALGLSYVAGLGAAVVAASRFDSWALAILAAITAFLFVGALTANIITTVMHYSIAIRREVW